MTPTDEQNILTVNHVKKYFPIRKGLLGRVRGYVRAVDDVSLTVKPGETLGLVGESGSGKTTLGRCIVRAHQPTSGEILYRTAAGTTVDLATLGKNALRPYRRELRMMFQDPFSSLNPRMTVLDIVGEPLRIHRVANGKQLEERVAQTLERVGLRPEYMRRYPHAFSGGQRQRIGIARAIVLDSRIVVADEAVSALDVSVRAQILKLLQSIQEDTGLAYLFITHDLGVVRAIADRVLVMYLGVIVEAGPVEPLFRAPGHPYTRALLEATRVPDPARRNTRPDPLHGDIPSPLAPPPGCRFHTRCPIAQDVCRRVEPPAVPFPDGVVAACHFATEVRQGVTASGPATAPSAAL